MIYDKFYLVTRDMTEAGIEEYLYVHGCGIAPNRKITFVVTPEKTVRADMYGRRKGHSEFIGSLSEDKMTVQEETTDEKIKKMMECRAKNEIPNFEEDISFVDVPLEKKVHIVHNITPIGDFRITLSHDISDNPFYETTKSIAFYVP